MTIHIELNADEERMLRERARLIGRDIGGYVHQLLQDHIRVDRDNLSQSDARPSTEFLDAELIDQEAIESCDRAISGKEVPSLEIVRQAMSKISGSMTRSVIEEREDRF